MQDFFHTPPRFGRFSKKLAEMNRDFPFLRIEPVGQSVLGRPLYGILLGNPERVVLFAGSFHAQEWISTLLLLRYLEHLALCYRESLPLSGFPVQESLSRQGLLMVPMVNPDGVSIALEGPASAGEAAPRVEKIMKESTALWQANANGVDLNHNYDAGFAALQEMERQAGITGPAPRQYGGPYPHSEPETRAMAALAQEKRVEAVYAFHAQGEEIYFRYGTATPPKSWFVARLLADLSGYQLVDNGGLCSHGGYKDYVIDRCHKPGYTVELGLGQNPLPISALEGIYQKTRTLLLAATLL